METTGELWRNQFRVYRIAYNSLSERPKAGTAYVMRAGGVELKGDPKFYEPIVDCIEKTPEVLTLGELITRVAPELRQGVVSAVSMLMHGGWVTPHQANWQSAQAVNRAIGEAVA